MKCLGNMDFTIRFYRVECKGCSTLRQACRPCADCGQRPELTEADIHVQRRTKIVKEALQIAKSSARDVLEITPLEMLSHSDQYLIGILEKIQKVTLLVADEKANGSEALASVAQEIYQLELWIEATPEWRPLAGYARRVKDIVSHVVKVFYITIEVLRSTDILQAQELGRNRQTALDDATRALHDAMSIIDTWQKRLDSSNPIEWWKQSLPQGLECTFDLLDDSNADVHPGIKVLEAYGLSTAELSVQLKALVCESLASSISDSDNFWSLVLQYRDWLKNHEAAVLSIVSSSEWASRSAEVSHDLIMIAKRSCLNPPETTRELVEALLRDGKDLMEQGIKLYLGTVCAATTRKSFHATQQAKISSLIQQSKQHKWKVPIDDQLALRVRNAYAHNNFGVTSEEKILLSKTAVSFDELQDTVLGILEFYMAMDMAFFLAVKDLSADIDGVYESTTILKQIIEGWIGWSNVEIISEQSSNTESSSVVIEATCPAEPLRLIAVLTVIGFFNQYHGQIVIRLTFGDEVYREIRVLLADYQLMKNLELDSPQEELSLLTIATRITIDTRPLVDQPYIRHYIASKVLHIFEADATPLNLPIEFRHRTRQLTNWKRIASETFGDTDLGELIQHIIRLHSSYYLDYPVKADWWQSLKQIQEMASTDATLLDDEWVVCS